MVWDLRGALLKKQEVESARLAEFDFRLRVRTMRLLAPQLGVEEEELVSAIMRKPDALVLADLAERLGIEPADLQQRHDACGITARAQLVDELGDPTPHRLA
jgi:hypothetical protein